MQIEGAYVEGRAAQAEIYGEPLGDILGRCARVLGLNQAQLAGVLGISAPMLSQLVNARRVKIGNPVAAQRLQVLHDAVDAVERGGIEREDALARVARVHGGGDILTTRRASGDDAVTEIQDLFRRVAGAPEHLSAAERLAETHPDIAEMLRVYGAGRTAEAREHLRSLQAPESRG